VLNSFVGSPDSEGEGADEQAATVSNAVPVASDRLAMHDAPEGLARNVKRNVVIPVRAI
jgi:hypothetical protein